MRPYILITNDDGVYSPGLHAMVEAAKNYGELLIAAPVDQQTSMGRAFPRSPDQGIIDPVVIPIAGQDTLCYAVHGSPGYAVAHAVLELAERKPDLCLSGINYGENLGTTVTCSGTLGAAFEANTHGIPAIAVSLEAPLSIQRYRNCSAYRWDTAQEITEMVLRQVLETGFPSQTGILNINVPLAATSGKDYRITTLSRQNYFNYLRPNREEFTTSFELKCERSVDLSTLEQDSDIYATYVDNLISITPMNLDMTAKEALDWHI